MVSGGVDSSVCCALLHKAIGVERVVAVHIDNGFLRKNESATVKESLEKIDLNLTGMQILPKSILNVVQFKLKFQLK